MKMKMVTEEIKTKMIKIIRNKNENDFTMFQLFLKTAVFS
jgi:hypothetical protein